MNASRFMDKQIMDLSRSKNDLNSPNDDFLDLINPQSEEEDTHTRSADEILPNYDFQPIPRPAGEGGPVPVLPSAAAPRVWNSLDSKPNSLSLRSYSSVEADPEKVVMEKAQKLSDSAIMSEIDRTMKKYTDNLLHAIDGLSARLSQIETRTHQIEYSVDDLKVSIGNNHGSSDGKMRHLENLLLEVQSSMQDVKDKQEVMDGHLQLAKLQILKSEKSTEAPSAPQSSVSSAPPQSQFQQFPPPPPPSSQIPPGHTQEAPIQHYQMPLPPQPQPQTLAPPVAPQPQPYPPNPTPPYPQHQQQQHQQHQQQHQPLPSANAPPQFQPPLAYHPEENPYIPQQSYPPNLRAPQTQPNIGPPNSQPYYNSPSPMYEPPVPSGRSSSSGYGPPSERYPPYSPPPSHYGSSGSSVKPQPHSPGAPNSNYPKLPTAMILPQAIPTASGINDGPSSGGGANRVPVDDVIDKVTTMGFPREQVRETVRRLTENGQSVDLNIVLDKLMNGGEVQPQKGWFGR